MDARNRILGVVFVLLAVLTLALEQPWRGDAHARTRATFAPLFPELVGAEDEVAEIQIRGDGAVTTMEIGFDRGKPHWLVREKLAHPADLVRMQALVASLRALQTRDVESVEADYHSTYEVADGQGVRITVRDHEGAVLADLVAGALRSQDVSAGQVPVLEFFLRPHGQDVVYRSGEFHMPPTDPAKWCDTRFLLAVDPENVHTLQRIDAGGDQSWKIVRGSVQSGGWRMVAPDSATVSEFAADSWIFTLTGLRAADVIEVLEAGITPAQLGARSDLFRVGIGDHEFVVEVGQALPGGLRAARVQGLAFLYALQQHEVDQLRQSVAAMLQEN